jgi:hypothetical protein
MKAVDRYLCNMQMCWELTELSKHKSSLTLGTATQLPVSHVTPHTTLQSRKGKEAERTYSFKTTHR